MAAQLYDIEPTKSYKTQANAIKAVEKMCEGKPWLDKLRYITVIYGGPVVAHQNRWMVIFIGMEAIQSGVFHAGFNCVS